MGRLAAAGHRHHCEQCGKDWLHPVYGCIFGAELACPEHPETPEPAPPTRPAEVWAPTRPIDPQWVKKD